MRAVAADGLGGIFSLISFSNLYYSRNPHEPQELHVISSNLVCDAIEKLLERRSIPQHIKFNFYADTIKDIDLAAELKQDGKTYILTPNYFGVYPGFSIENSNISWGEILENRFLEGFFIKPRENNILLALDSAQENNSYQFTDTLVSKLCKNNPNSKVYYPFIKSWAGKEIVGNFDISEMEMKFANFITYSPESLAADLLWIGKNIKYFIGIDGGILNYAYVLGREYIMLDSRYGSIPFKQRWRHQGFRNSVPINTNPTQVAAALKLLIEKPHLSALDKIDLLNL